MATAILTLLRAPLITLDVGGEKPLPTELRILPAGPFETELGPLTFDARAAELVLANLKERGVELPFDWNHGMTPGLFEPVSDPAEAGKAAGWFNAELRNGELWAANVRWTPLAQQKLRDLEYRYLSPTLAIERIDETFEPAHVLEPDGRDIGRRRVAKLMCVALTNTPAMHGIDPIVASAAGGRRQETSMDKALLVLLGLAETATLDDVKKATEKLKADGVVLLSFRGDVLKLTGKDQVPEALGVLEGWKKKAEQYPVLEAELAKLTAQARESEVTALVEQGKREGKLTPAMEPWARELGKTELARLKAFLEVAPKVIPGAAGEKNEPPGAGGKTWEELSAMEKHNLHQQNRALYDALKADHARRTGGEQ